MAGPPIAARVRVTVDRDMHAQTAARAMANPIQRRGDEVLVRLIVPSSSGFLVAEIPHEQVDEILNHVAHFQNPQDRRDFIRQWLADNVQSIRRSHSAQVQAAPGADTALQHFDFGVVPVRQVAIVRRVEDIVPRPVYSPSAARTLQRQVVAASRDQ